MLEKAQLISSYFFVLSVILGSWKGEGCRGGELGWGNLFLTVKALRSNAIQSKVGWESIVADQSHPWSPRPGG